MKDNITFDSGTGDTKSQSALNIASIESSAFAYGGFDGSNVVDYSDVMYCDPMTVDFSDEADEAAQLLEAHYEKCRSCQSNTIPVTVRFLESLIRLSEALAKMRYRSIVTKHDALEAVRLWQVATQTAATDPRTGRIDMDMIATGRTAADREWQDILQTHLTELWTARRGTRMAMRDITKQLEEVSVLLL